MDAIELRIGNYVNWNGENAKVSQLLERDVCFKCGEDCLFEDIEPIPLTKEWLIRFGFTQNQFDIRYWWISGLKIKFNAKDEIVFKYSESIVKLKYVHQLQNLYFALLNRDLKYNFGKNLEDLPK